MSDWLPPAQRVVVTGMGAVTPNGLDMPSTWAGVRDGESKIGPITLFDVSDYRVKIAGEAHGFDPLNYMGRKEARRSDRFVQFTRVAADEAVKHARLDTSQNPDEMGV